MKMLIGPSLFAMLALFAPIAAQAQPGGDGAPARGDRPGPGLSVRVLVENQQALDLTADQVARLGQIDADLTARNEPLLARLREAGVAMPSGGRIEMRGSRPDGAEPRPELTPGQREQMRGRMEERRDRMGDRDNGAVPGARGGPMALGNPLPEELRPVMEQLRSNTRTANEEVRSVLTADQLRQYADLLRDRAPDRMDARRERR